MYERGAGVPRNAAEAALWYRKAAAQDLEKARDALSKLQSASAPK